MQRRWLVKRLMLIGLLLFSLSCYAQESPTEYNNFKYEDLDKLFQLKQEKMFDLTSSLNLVFDNVSSSNNDLNLSLMNLKPLVIDFHSLNQSDSLLLADYKRLQQSMTLLEESLQKAEMKTRTLTRWLIISGVVLFVGGVATGVMIGVNL